MGMEESEALVAVPALEQEAMVQDDARERQIADYLGLQRSPGRSGEDATDEGGRPYELKSTTVRDVGTARDVGPEHVAAWRARYWIVAKGRLLQTNGKRFEFERLLVAHTSKLEAEFSRIEQLYRQKYEPCARIIEIARTHGANPADIRDASRWMDRGSRLNNPKIRLDNVVWQELDRENRDAARQQLREYAERNPI